MPKELDDLNAAISSFKAEVTADVQTLLDKNATLVGQVSALTQQIAAGATGIDPSQVEALATDLQQTTAALHAKLTAPAPA